MPVELEFELKPLNPIDSAIRLRVSKNAKVSRKKVPKKKVSVPIRRYRNMTPEQRRIWRLLSR